MSATPVLFNIFGHVLVQLSKTEYISLTNAGSAATDVVSQQNWEGIGVGVGVGDRGKLLAKAEFFLL